MDTNGWDRPAPDDRDQDCDLVLLDLYVLLDTLRLRKVVLRDELTQTGPFPPHDPMMWGAQVATVVAVVRASVECSQGLRQEAAHLREEARRLRGEAADLRHPPNGTV